MVHLNYEIVSELRNINKDGTNLFEKVSHIYKIEANKLITSINEGLSKNDVDSLCNCIHSLKSCSGNIGAINLANLCNDLLINLKTTKAINNEAIEAIGEIKTEFIDVLNSIDTEINKK